MARLLPFEQVHSVDCFGHEETSTLLPAGVEALLLQLQVQSLAKLCQSGMQKNNLFTPMHRFPGTE